MLVSGENPQLDRLFIETVGGAEIGRAQTLDLTVESAAVRATDGRMYELLTPSSGLDPLPAVYQLGQNYPNPFNPSTTIRYQLPETAQIRVDIYDILGQRVRTLVDERKVAGFYSVNWRGIDDRGRKVATGMYFYRLSTPAFTDVKKLLLMK